MALNFYCLYGQSTIGSVERLDPEINSLIPKNAKIEILGSGYTWSEGPIWVENLNGLLFNDPPENKMYLWTEGSGVKLYLDPSGYTGYAPSSLKKGSNGMTFNTKPSMRRHQLHYCKQNEADLRDELQKKIDNWHKSNKGEELNKKDKKKDKKQ